jgi:hypothetical protein
VLELFRRNYFVNTLILVPYAIVIRLHTFIWPQRFVYEYTGNNVFLQWFYGHVSYPLLQSVICTLLIIGHAIFINRIYLKNRIPNEYTLFPGAIYIVLVSASDYLIQLSPEILGLTFIIIMISQMFKTYKNHLGSIHIFNTGFCGCLAFLLNPGLVWMFIYGFIGLMILRSFKGVEKMQYITGFLTPIFLALSMLYYLQKDIGSLVSDFINEFGFIDLGISLSIEKLIYLGVLFLIFLIVFFSYNKYTIRKSIQAQKKIDLIYWLSIIALLTTVFSDGLSYSGLLLLCVVISILFAMNITWIKNKIYTEMIHLLLLSIIIYTFYI